MKLERTKNTLRNTVWFTVNKAVTILIPFFLRTIIIYTLGTKYLGLSSLFKSILQVLNLAELGFGEAVIFGLYKPIAENDTNKICALLSLYRKIYRLVGLFILIIGLALAPFLSQLIKGSWPNDINFYVLYIMYLADTVLSYILFSYMQMLFFAHQRDDVIQNLGTVAHLILYALQITTLFIFHNYYWYVSLLLAYTLFVNIYKYFLAKKYYPDYKCRGKVLPSQQKELLKNVGALFGHKVSTVIRNSVDDVVLSTFIGLTIVAIYDNYYYIMSATIAIAAILSKAMLAGIGNSIVTESVEKNRSDFDKITFINAWIAGWACICLLCLYQPFMKIWMGADLMLPVSSVVLFAVYFYVWQMRQSVLLYKDANGMWRADKFKPYVEIAVNLTTSIILVKLMGVNGVILGTIVSMLVGAPWEIIVLFRQYFGRGMKQYVCRLGAYTAIIVTSAVGTYYICACMAFASEIGMLVARLLICCILPNGIFWLLGHRTEEYRYLLDKGRALIKRKT